MRPTPIRFPPQILGTLDLALAHDAVGKNVFHRPDKNEIGIAAQISANRSLAAGQGDAAVAAAHGRGNDAGRGYIDELKIEIVLRIKTRFLGKPRHRHSDARRGLQADELFRGHSRRGETENLADHGQR
jgi:hypothetical protein